MKSALENEGGHFEIKVGSGIDRSLEDVCGYYVRAPQRDAQPRGALVMLTGMDGDYTPWIETTAKPVAQHTGIDVLVMDMRRRGWARGDRLISDVSELQKRLTDLLGTERIVRLGHSQSCWVQAHAVDRYQLPTAGFYFLTPYPQYPDWFGPLNDVEHPKGRWVIDALLSWFGPFGKRLADAKIDPAIPVRYVMGAYDVGLLTVSPWTRERYTEHFKKQAPHGEVVLLRGNHNMNEDYFRLKDSFNVGNTGGLVEDITSFTKRALGIKT